MSGMWSDRVVRRFLAGFLLAGAVHLLDNGTIHWMVLRGDSEASSPLLHASTLLFCINLAIYVYLILYWAQSVKARLLPSRERRYMLAAVVFMLFLLFERAAKYRIAGDTALSEYLWYAYYLPVILLPTLLLMIALRMDARTRAQPFDERWLLIPAAALSILILTNHWHELVFRSVNGRPLYGHESQHTYGILYYLYYAFVLGFAAAALYVLTKTNLRLRARERVAAPYNVLALTVVLFLIQRIMLNVGVRVDAFRFPELYVFCSLGLYETCLRSRLIPHNENYAGFFACMRQPAVITDQALSPVFRTAAAPDYPKKTLQDALISAVSPAEDMLLNGRPVQAGFVFWTEDESELHRMNNRLRDANEILDTENTLIRAETELAAERARVDSRNRIYAQISDRTLSEQKRIEALLRGIGPGDAELRETMARICILNAYIKRAANLMLADEGSPDIDRRELWLALSESGRYLLYLGITMSAAEPTAGRIDREKALALYASFEALCEAMLTHVTCLNAAIDGDGLRLAADAAIPGELPETELPVRMWESEGLWYYAVGPAKGGAA